MTPKRRHSKEHQKKTKQDKNKIESKKKKNEASKNDSGENKGNNKESQKSTPDVNEASGTYYITAPSLNVRSGDGTNYDVLGSLSANSKIEITGKTSNDWYQFDFQGQKGYISSNYTSTEKAETTANDTSDKHTSDNNNKTDDKGKSSNKENIDQNKSNKNVVDKMKNLGDSQQVVLITTKGYNTSTGLARTFEKDSNGKWQQILSATSYIGKNGFTGNKTEGDLIKIMNWLDPGKSPVIIQTPESELGNY